MGDFKKEIDECKKKIKDENLSFEETNKIAVDFVKNSKCKTVGVKNAKKKSNK